MMATALACSYLQVRDVQGPRLLVEEVRSQTAGDTVRCYARKGEGMDSDTPSHVEVVEDSSHLY